MSSFVMPQSISDQELDQIVQPAADWLWHGFIARGQITLLTSLWKAGKTTLLAMLLGRRKQGGELAGLAVQPGKTVIVTEEQPALWAERARRHDFGGQVLFFPRPFQGIPTSDQWRAFLAGILALRSQHAFDLVVIDPLAPFCLGENHAKIMFDTLLPFGVLARENIAVLILHHPAKAEKPDGHAARGSGALLSHVDISIDMRHPHGNSLTRRRRLISLSRHAATPRRLFIELNADGNDYLVLADEPDDDFEANWNILRMVFDDATDKLTREGVLKDWPPDFDKPSPATLWRWLRSAVDRGLLLREGTGYKNDPFYYWLKASEEVWSQDPMYTFLEEDRKLRAKLMLETDPRASLRRGVPG
jgi:hypothetical protein